MSRVPSDERAGLRSLALLNHRLEDTDPIRDWFQDLGWSVQASFSLEDSLDLLHRVTVEAAVVLPLTLHEESLEWERLREGLSPARPIPWIVVPWLAAPSRRAMELLMNSTALADWHSQPVELAELEARVDNLVRLQGILSAVDSRIQQLEGQLTQDHKTGLFNDPHFRARLREEFARSKRDERPFTVILIDLDRFKQVNDMVSYAFGDQVLRAVGRILMSCTRSIDLCARIGGDEFAVLLPNTGLPEALLVANRLREAAGRERVSSGGQGSVQITFCQGLATYPSHAATQAEQLFLEANEQLKQAKRSGRNQISFPDSRLTVEMSHRNPDRLAPSTPPPVWSPEDRPAF